MNGTGKGQRADGSAEVRIDRLVLDIPGLDPLQARELA
jgi:hypothetical protein